MKLSTKGRYASRAMLELAKSYGKEPMLLRDIAQRQEIPERYLERIMANLVSAGLARSLRGQHGGFSLSKPPNEIHLKQIIQTVEGPIAPVSCVDNPKLCSRVDICITHDIWTKLKDTISENLNSITLENMVEMEKEKLSKSKNQMYFI